MRAMKKLALAAVLTVFAVVTTIDASAAVVTAAAASGWPSDTASVAVSCDTAANGFDFTLGFDSTNVTYAGVTDGSGVTSVVDSTNAAAGAYSTIVVSAALDISATLTANTPIVTVDFTIGSSVAYDSTAATVTPSGVVVDEGAADTGVAGNVLVYGIVIGDVTGSSAVTALDAAYVIDRAVAGGVAFPIEDTAIATAPVLNTAWAVVTNDPPVWVDVALDGTIDNPLPPSVALAVADAEQTAYPGSITSADTTAILQKSAGIAPTLPTAPALLALGASDLLHVTSTATRPGASISMSLDLADLAGITNGDLVLDYDGRLVQPVSVSFDSGDMGTGEPLFAHNADDRQLRIAFASAYAIDGARVNVVFETTHSLERPVAGSIRASNLRLNTSTIPTEFTHRFNLEPYRSQLLANYPNPFNPETWIPFELAADADVTIHIYALDGVRMRTLELGRVPVGMHTDQSDAAYWDGTNEQGERVASGTYIYELIAGDYHAMRRMVILK